MYMLSILFGLQTTILISTLPDRTVGSLQQSFVEKRFLSLWAGFALFLIFVQRAHQPHTHCFTLKLITHWLLFKPVSRKLGIIIWDRSFVEVVCLLFGSSGNFEVTPSSTNIELWTGRLQLSWWGEFSCTAGDCRSSFTQTSASKFTYKLSFTPQKLAAHWSSPSPFRLQSCSNCRADMDTEGMTLWEQPEFLWQWRPGLLMTEEDSGAPHKRKNVHGVYNLQLRWTSDSKSMNKTGT